MRVVRVGLDVLFWHDMVIWRIGEYFRGDSSMALSEEKMYIRIAKLCLNYLLQFKFFSKTIDLPLGQCFIMDYVRRLYCGVQS